MKILIFIALLFSNCSVVHEALCDWNAYYIARFYYHDTCWVVDSIMVNDTCLFKKFKCKD